MNLPNGLADGLRRMDPAMIRMQKSNHILIPGYAGAIKREYAKPVPPPAANVKQKTTDTSDLVGQNGKG
jgi:hypothetical protein